MQDIENCDWVGLETLTFSSEVYFEEIFLHVLLPENVHHSDSNRLVFHDVPGVFLMEDIYKSGLGGDCDYFYKNELYLLSDFTLAIFDVREIVWHLPDGQTIRNFSRKLIKPKTLGEFYEQEIFDSIKKIVLNGKNMRKAE